MAKFISIFLMLLMTTSVMAQKTKLDIQFDHESSLWKYLVKQVRGPETRIIPAMLPYAHSSTIKLTLDLEGEIIDLQFIEKAEKEIFNQIFEKLARSTNGKWKFTEVSEEVKQVYVIIPFLHLTPPDSQADYPTALKQHFTDYHNSLSYKDIEGCNETNCVIWKQIINYTGTPVR